MIGKKGISPLIAAVLLIAFTMTIAGLMATWASSFMSEKTTNLTAEDTATQKCIGINFDVTSNFINDTHRALLINNNGVVNIVGINVDAITTDYDTKNIYHNETIEIYRGMMKSLKINSLDIGANNFTSIRTLRITSINCPGFSREISP